MNATIIWDQNKESHWQQIKAEIDANRSVILNSNSNGGALTTSGHYIVVVGYRESPDPNQREIITYDPFGRWTGVIDKYTRNTTAVDPPGGTVGRWVFYKFNQLGTIYSVTAQRQINASVREAESLPDEIYLLEDEEIVTYTGHGQDPNPIQLYLPLMMKQ
jgi:hypothetical protein